MPNNIHPRDEGENTTVINNVTVNNAPTTAQSEVPNPRTDGKACPTQPTPQQVSLSEAMSDGVLLGGKKYDNAKPRFSLVPQGTLYKVINVLEHGANKYGYENWKLVDNAKQRYFDAHHRHMEAWWSGEKNDPDTGESHLAHAICCLLFLLYSDS